MVKNFKRNLEIKVYGVKVIISVNKNDAVCDVQPRVGKIMETYQGRQVDLALESILDAYREFYKVLNK
jgi:hypothetical protein